MKDQIRLYKKLILIAVPLIILIIFFEVKARELQNGFGLKKSYLEKNIEKINVLILGSSHGYYSINPEVLNHNSFNLAYFSQDLYYDYMLLDKYKSNLKNLKCIILSMSYFSLWYDLNDTPEKWRKNFYSKYFNINPKSLLICSDLADIKTYSFAFFYRIDNTLLGTINPKLFSFGTKMNSTGWNTDTVDYSLDSIPDFIKKGKDRVEFTNKLINKKYYEDNEKYIFKIIEYCNENNIKLIFITTPVSYPYSFYMDKNYYDDFKKTVNGYADNKNIFYINYFMDNRFTMRDFNDYDHLNGKGAMKFSRILKDTVESLKILN